jgi:periplasmic protein TonB
MLTGRFVSTFVALIGGSILVCGALLLLKTVNDVPNGNDELIPAITHQASVATTPQGGADASASAAPLPSRPAEPDYTAATNEPQLGGDRPGRVNPVAPLETDNASASLGETDQPWTLGTPAASSEPPMDASPPIQSTGDAIKSASVEEGPVAHEPVASTEQPAAPQPRRPDQHQNTDRPAHSQPMALAPSNTPTNESSYDDRVWASLARHKPRVGQSGSTMVSFIVGPNGGLRSVRVSGSSGNPRLDQMALATVRNAAPFPPIPQNRAGALSYTIRIYFR